MGRQGLAIGVIWRRSPGPCVDSPHKWGGADALHRQMGKKAKLFPATLESL